MISSLGLTRSLALTLACILAPELVLSQNPPTQTLQPSKPERKNINPYQLLQRPIIERPLITGRKAMVTSIDPLASMAGMKILEEGGNAFDAAVAAAAAMAEPAIE